MANRTVETLASRISDDELLAFGITDFEPEAVDLVVTAARNCEIPDETIDEALTEFTGEPYELAPAEASGPSDEPRIDPNDFGTERSDTLNGGVVFDLLTEAGRSPTSRTA